MIKFTARLLLLTVLCGLTACCLISCANVSIPVPSGGPSADNIAAPYSPGYQAAAPANMKINLFGGDLDQFQATYPGGPAVAIAGLKTSPGLQIAANMVESGIKWAGLGAIGKAYFKDKSVASTQTGRTARAKIAGDTSVKTTQITSEAATRQAELQLLAPPATGP